MVMTIQADAVRPVHLANACTGETPIWDHRTDTLWWIDIQGQRLLGLRPECGEELAFNMPSLIGMVQLCRDGLVLGLEDGIYYFDPSTASGERLISVEEDNRRTRINDGQVDAKGRLWFGTMEKTGSGEKLGSLYRLDHDGSLLQFRKDMMVPNSLCFSPDGKTMYFSDSRTGVLEAFDYDIEAGRPTNGRVFMRYEGETPDGTGIDAEGAVWIAVINGSRIERRLPDGSLDQVIELPVSRPTMPALGGPAGDTIYITSQRRVLPFDKLRAEPFAGSLLAVSAAIRPFRTREVTCL